MSWSCPRNDNIYVIRNTAETNVFDNVLFWLEFVYCATGCCVLIARDVTQLAKTNGWNSTSVIYYGSWDSRVEVKRRKLIFCKLYCFWRLVTKLVEMCCQVLYSVRFPCRELYDKCVICEFRSKIYLLE